MRKLKIIEHISLDGVIQVTDEDGSFPYGDWTAPYRTPQGRDAVMAAHGEHFDLLLGRRTYDAWSGWWPQAPRSGVADRMNAATKFVVTHRPECLSWGPAQGLAQDLAQDVRQLKLQDGNDLVLSGSCSLTSPLLKHGLVDELVLAVYPVLVGAGNRLFAQGTPACVLTLQSSQALPSGIVFNSYQVAGPLKPA